MPDRRRKCYYIQGMWCKLEQPSLALLSPHMTSGHLLAARDGVFGVCLTLHKVTLCTHERHRRMVLSEGCWWRAGSVQKGLPTWRGRLCLIRPDPQCITLESGQGAPRRFCLQRIQKLQSVDENNLLYVVKQWILPKTKTAGTAAWEWAAQWDVISWSAGLEQWREAQGGVS